MVLRAGQLRHRIEIQTNTATADADSGELVPAWSTTDTDADEVWGSVEEVSGSELNRLQQINADTNIKVTIRHRDGLTPAQRLKFGSRIFDILAVLDPNTRAAQNIVLCNESS